MDGFNLGDLIGLIIVFSLYLVAASGKRKKPRRPAQSRGRHVITQEENTGRSDAARARQTGIGFDAASADAVKHDEKDCAAERIHLHEATQLQFAQAMEGEDPCHAGGSDSKENQEKERFELQDDINREALAQDVLRGVIMSEILTRPHERAALRRGRR